MPDLDNLKQDKIKEKEEKIELRYNEKRCLLVVFYYSKDTHACPNF